MSAAIGLPGHGCLTSAPVVMRCNGWYGRDRFWQSAPGDARSQEFVIDFGGERKVASVEIEWEVC